MRKILLVTFVLLLFSVSSVTLAEEESRYKLACENEDYLYYFDTHRITVYKFDEYDEFLLEVWFKVVETKKMNERVTKEMGKDHMFAKCKYWLDHCVIPFNKDHVLNKERLYRVFTQTLCSDDGRLYRNEDIVHQWRKVDTGELLEKAIKITLQYTLDNMEKDPNIEVRRQVN